VASSSNYQAWVEVVPEFKGFNKTVRRESERSLSAAGDEGGKTFGKGLSGALGKIAVPLAVAGAAAVAGVGLAAGAALSKGLDRALSIQDATAKLTGLGNSAENVQKILNNALDSVRGTAFGLGDAAGVAAGAVAAGIEPGEKLTKVLKLTADAATIAGTDLNSMGSIFNKVAASGKLQGDVIAQLQDAGVPVLQFVAKQMGVTASEAANLASEGKVSFEIFAAAMEAGLGGAALASGSTARGAFANVGAALGRLGALFTTPVVAAAPAFFASLTAGIDKLTEKAKPFADQFGAFVGPALERVGEAIQALVNGDTSKVSDLFDDLTGGAASFSPLLVVLEALAPVIPVVAASLKSMLTENGPAFTALGESIGELVVAALPLIPAVTDLLIALLPLAEIVVELAVVALPPLVDGLTALVSPTDSSATSANDLTTAVGAVAAGIGFLLTLFPGGITAFQTLASVVSGAKSPLDFVSDTLNGKFGTALQFAGQNVLNLAEVVRGRFDAIRQTVAEKLGQVQATGQRVWSGLPAPVQSALSAIGTTVSGGITGAVSTLASLPGRALGALSGLGGTLVGAGRSLVEGFVSGITGGIQSAATAAARVARAAVDAAKAALDINSPSRVFRDEVGLMVGLGMAEGIDRSAGAVAKSVSSLAVVPDVPARAFAYDTSVAPGYSAGATNAPAPEQNFYVYEAASANATALAVARRQNGFAV
jgi:tape measure domain-containing protein